MDTAFVPLACRPTAAHNVLEVVILDSQPSESQDRRSRPRARNWSEVEMICLAQAKKVEQDLDMDNIGQRRFLSSVQKWKEISLFMHTKGYTDRASQVCNTKWNNLFGDWKSIRDFILSSGGTSYYNMSKNERVQAKLVPKFSKDLYDLMKSFCLQRPCMVPPSTFDSGLGNSSQNLPQSVPQAPRFCTAPDAPPGSPSEATMTGLSSPDNREANDIGLGDGGAGSNCAVPGDNVAGSTGRTKRRRSIDISGVLKTSHDSLVTSLDKQMTQRMKFFDKQFELEKAKMDIEKIEQESASADRKALVSVLQDMANAMNVLAHRGFDRH